jgi:CxC2 like cysteine cluster associated with KDZ transposases
MNIPSTHYELLSNGNLGSSTHILRVTAPCSENPDAVPPVPDSSTANLGFEFDMDPAYLEHLNKDFFPTKRQRTYVSNVVVHRFSLCFIIFQVNPITRWLSDRDTFLAEFHRLEGRGDYSSITCLCCGEMENSPALYRCIDCSGTELMCQSCIVLVHKSNPLHRVKVRFLFLSVYFIIFKLHLQTWTSGSYFKKVTLMQIGLRVQLSHMVHETCRNPIRAPGGDFVVLDINGIHEVGVDFCGCESSKPHFVQLLQYRWFPASVDRPKTAATLGALKFFQLLNFESKVSSFEFHSTLARLTDNTGTAAHKVCDFPAFHHHYILT